MAVDFDILKRKELRAAVELVGRAFENYEYFTNILESTGGGWMTGWQWMLRQVSPATNTRLREQESGILVQSPLTRQHKALASGSSLLPTLRITSGHMAAVSLCSLRTLTRISHFIKGVDLRCSTSGSLFTRER